MKRKRKQSKPNVIVNLTESQVDMAILEYVLRRRLPHHTGTGKVHIWCAYGKQGMITRAEIHLRRPRNGPNRAQAWR